MSQHCVVSAAAIVYAVALIRALLLLLPSVGLPSTASARRLLMIYVYLTGGMLLLQARAHAQRARWGWGAGRGAARRRGTGAGRVPQALSVESSMSILRLPAADGEGAELRLLEARGFLEDADDELMHVNLAKAPPEKTATGDIRAVPQRETKRR